MTAKRWDGAAFQDILTTRKRWDGATWVDLTIAKRWDGAAWIDITDLLTGGLSITITPAIETKDRFIAEPAPSTAVVTSDLVTGTASGGTAPYTYQWVYVSGSSAIFPIDVTDPSTQFAASMGKNQQRAAVWQLIVTDATLDTASGTVNLVLSYTTGL